MKADPNCKMCQGEGWRRASGRLWGWTGTECECCCPDEDELVEEDCKMARYYPTLMKRLEDWMEAEEAKSDRGGEEVDGEAEDLIELIGDCWLALRELNKMINDQDERYARRERALKALVQEIEGGPK